MLILKVTEFHQKNWSYQKSLFSFHELAKIVMVPRVNGYGWALSIFATSKINPKVQNYSSCLAKIRKPKTQIILSHHRKGVNQSTFKRRLSCLGQCIILKVYRLHIPRASWLSWMWTFWEYQTQKHLEIKKKHYKII